MHGEKNVSTAQKTTQDSSSYYFNNKFMLLEEPIDANSRNETRK